MEPIFKEEYILSKDSYFGFTLDQNKQALNKNRKGIKVTSNIQIGVGVLFILSMIISGQKVGILFILLAVAVMLTGLSGSFRLKGYEKKIAESLEKSYETREYGKNFFEVVFFENRLTYLIGGHQGELLYSEFETCYDGEKYFAVHFASGEVIIFNRDCQIEKIRELLSEYKAANPQSQPLEKASEVKAPVLADDWYMQETPGEGMVGEEMVGEKTIDDEIVGEKTIDDEIVREKTIDDEIVSEKTIDDEIVREKTIDDEIVGEKTIDDEIVSEKTIDDEIVREKTIDDEIVREKTIDDEIVGEKTK